MKNNKKMLYESIMMNIAKEVKHAILEGEAIGLHSTEETTIKMELSFFDGFYETAYYDLIDREIEYEIEYARDEDETELTYDDFEIDYNGFKEKVAKEFTDKWKEYAPDFVKSAEYVSVWSPREYNFSTDKVYANVTLVQGWKETMLSFMDRHENELREIIREDWTSRSGFTSFIDNTFEGFKESIEDEDATYIEIMIAYMMVFNHCKDKDTGESDLRYRMTYELCERLMEQGVAHEFIKCLKDKGLSESYNAMDSLTKKFRVNYKDAHGKFFTISRADYEDMPCPMIANDWTDEQMKKLAKAIEIELRQYKFDEKSNYFEDDVDDAFWKEMEECAVHMGMQYYEDLEE